MGRDPLDQSLFSTLQKTHRRRVAQNWLELLTIPALAAIMAGAAAALWPIQGKQIQSGFFLSLTSASLTVFGLVFSLCLIGTQLVATRTNSSRKRIFGSATWLYLVL